MSQDVKEFFRKIQLRPAVISGHVSGVTVDAATGVQQYATVAVGGSVIRIPIDASAPGLAAGDQVRLEQYGFAASAEYRLAGIEAGARPASGAFQVLNDGTQIGGVAYAGGDFITGKIAAGNIFSEYATGRLYHRVGVEVYGIEYPTGEQLFGHALKTGGDWLADGPNVLITPTSVRLRNTTTDIMRFDVNGVAYIEQALEIGSVNGHIQAGKTAYGAGVGFWVGADSGVVKLDVGNATDYLRWDGTRLDVSGSMRIGKPFGPMIRGGVAIDYDGAGQPLPETTTRYAWRIYDATGLPKVSLLTGTRANPDVAAALFGAENDANYLWYKDGLLRLKGEAVIDGGQLGGFLVDEHRITSTNNRVVLVNDQDLEFAEGLLLITGVADDAGTIAWRKTGEPADAAKYAGIISTYWQPSAPGNNQHASMLIGVSDLFSAYESHPSARLRLEANTPTSPLAQKAYLELESVIEETPAGDQTRAYLRTNAELQVKSLAQVAAGELVIHNLSGETLIAAGDFVPSTSQGTAGRLAANGAGIECVANGYSMYWQLNAPAYFCGAPVKIKTLYIHYKTTTNNAYIASVRVVVLSTNDGTVATELEYSTPLGQGVTGVGYANILENEKAFPPFPLLLRVDLAGVSDYGHVVVYGFRVEWENQ